MAVIVVILSVMVMFAVVTKQDVTGWCKNSNTFTDQHSCNIYLPSRIWLAW